MVRIAIIQASLRCHRLDHVLGSVGYENPVNDKGERLIWLDHWALDRLNHLRGPGESDVILRLATEVS
jgi:hypothetical protein